MEETSDVPMVAESRFSRGAATVARFCFCAIPGAFLFVFLGPLCLIAAFAGQLSELDVATRLAWFAGGIASLAAGAPLVLYGTRRWKRWAYLIPLVTILPSLTFALDDKPARLLLLLVPFGLAAAVRGYYRRRPAPAESPAGRTS